MKTTLITFILSLAFNASAIAPAPFVLQDGDSAITPIRGDVRVVTPVPTCPQGAMCEVVTNVEIVYQLSGCSDGFKSYKKVVRNDDGTTDIYVTALNISNKKSLVEYCVAFPVATDRIVLGMGFYSAESVRVHFLGTIDDLRE